MPRPSHEKKDPLKVEGFRTILAGKLQALDLPKNHEMSLWVHDEMRYGLDPLLRRMWSLVGTRVITRVNRRFKWGYVFGAIEVDGNGSEFLCTDGLGKGKRKKRDPLERLQAAAVFAWRVAAVRAGVRAAIV